MGADAGQKIGGVTGVAVSYNLNELIKLRYKNWSRQKLEEIRTGVSTQPQPPPGLKAAAAPVDVAAAAPFWSLEIDAAANKNAIGALCLTGICQQLEEHIMTAKTNISPGSGYIEVNSLL